MVTTAKDQTCPKAGPMTCPEQGSHHVVMSPLFLSDTISGPHTF